MAWLREVELREQGAYLHKQKMFPQALELRRRFLYEKS
nr:MAG TPA: hypothetical protein [Caudoviricetes sp.]